MENASFKGYDSIFSSRLRLLLNKKKISKQTLADIIGISRQAISQYCDGSTIPNADKLTEIAKYFNVSLDYLAGLSDVSTVDVNIQGICNQTGLSERAVKEALPRYKTVLFQNVSVTDSLNFIINSDLDEKTSLLYKLRDYITITAKTNKSFYIQDNGTIIDNENSKNDELWESLTVANISFEKLIETALFTELMQDIRKLREQYQAEKSCNNVND